MKSIYWYWESAIPKEICEFIISHANWEKSEAGRIHGKNAEHLNSPKIRITEIAFDSRLSLAECILRSYITEANKAAKWNFTLTDIQNIQIGKYVKGGHYEYHEDASVLSSLKIDRKISAVLFLSDPNSYEGGQFEFKNAKTPYEKFLQGSIIVFPSFVKHRVLPVTKGIRYSAVAWAVGPSFK
jgi:PKHD-type hydroxylase